MHEPSHSSINHLQEQENTSMKTLTIHLTIGGTVLTSLLLITGPAFTANPENMVLVPRGEYIMGSNDHQDEKPHNVVLDAYYIDKYEASNKEYKEFMKASGHPAPAYWDDPRLNKPEQPVVGVNWYDGSAFCEWKGKPAERPGTCLTRFALP